MMSFPLKNSILLITAEPNVNIDKIAYKNIQILGKECGNFLRNRISIKLLKNEDQHKITYT